eukprot:SAG25_NODE_1873_length_2224_cov_1.659294_2_plen_89_part_00
MRGTAIISSSTAVAKLAQDTPDIVATCFTAPSSEVEGRVCAAWAAPPPAAVRLPLGGGGARVGGGDTLGQKRAGGRSREALVAGRCGT